MKDSFFALLLSVLFDDDEGDDDLLLFSFDVEADLALLSLSLRDIILLLLLVIIRELEALEIL